MAKLIDVAERAGVSITTASMALSGKGRISADVRKRVNDTADALGYKRNRQPAGAHWALLLNMGPENDYLFYFFNPIIRQLQSSARQQGFTISILPVFKESGDEEIFQSLMEVKASSVFTIHIASSNLFNKLESMGIPCVIINNSSFQDQFFTVCVDDFQGAYEGTNRLIQAGHRRIAFMDYPRESLPGIMADRFFGFRKAVEEHRIPFPEDWRITVDYNEDGQMEESLSRLFDRKAAAPTALFLHDDMLAVKAVHILRERGIRIPGDLSLIAPGDTMNYALPEVFNISTMRIDTALMGQYAVNMLLERLRKGEQAPHILKIKQTFIDRGSILPPQE